MLATIAIWAIFIERQLFVIRRDEIPALPEGFAPIRILQIGDIHLAPWQKRKLRFLRRLSEEDFDLVVMTGDNLGHQKAIEPLLEGIAPLLPRAGVFVNGSNDYFAPMPKNPLSYLSGHSRAPRSEPLNTKAMTDAFERAGWVNLNNAAAELEVAGRQIRFVGVDDYHIGRVNFDLFEGQDRFTIALTHAPYLRALEALAEKGASIIFAGHTHGGQVRLPLIGALTTNCDLPNRFARGKSRWIFGGKQVWLSVVAGLGNSIFAPVRFFCLPEVRLVTLLAKA